MEGKMKNLALILVSLFVGVGAFAYDGGQDNGDQDGQHGGQQDQQPNYFGTWRSERPTSETPYAIATGEVTFDEDSITYESTCSYYRGPVVKATVTAEVEYGDNMFYIPRSVQVREDDHGFTCDAFLSQGHYDIRMFGDSKLVLFNRATGWRMTFIR
jgi:hypothetical protein